MQTENTNTIGAVLGWLDQGAALALRRHGAQARHDQAIWSLLVLAMAEAGTTERSCAILGWMVYFARAHNPLRFRLGVQALAGGGGLNDLSRALGQPVTRQAAYQFRQRAAGYILAGLERDYGIVPGAGCGFEFGSAAAAVCI